MTRPTNLSQPLPTLSTGWLGREAPNPITDPPDPIDRAAGLDVFVAASDASIAPVQEAEHIEPLGGSGDVVMSSPPTAGNLLTLAVTVRSPVATDTTVDGWTVAETTTFTTAGNTSLSTFYRTAGVGETTTVAAVAGGTGSRWLAHVQEWSAGLAFDTSTTNTDDLSSTISGGSVTPTAGQEALIYTAAGITKGDGFNVTVTPGADVTEIWDDEAGGNSPQGWAGYRVVPSASGSYELTGSLLSGGSPIALDTAVHTLVFARSTGPVQAGPNATDDDDTTYVEASGTLIVAIDLGDAYRIVRGRLFVGTDGAGARTYTLQGANAADYSDAVTLDTTAFTATGSFTGQEVLFDIASPDHYRYYRITSDTSEDVRVYTIELYEASVGDLGGVTDHGALDGLADNDHPQYALAADLTAHLTDTVDAHDASAISYDGYESGLDAIDVQAAIDEHITDHPGGTPTLDYGEDGDISTLDYDDTADAGVLDEVARADHVHGMPSASGGGSTLEPTPEPHAEDDEGDVTDTTDPPSGWDGMVGTLDDCDRNSTVAGHIYIRKAANANTRVDGPYKSVPLADGEAWVVKMSDMTAWSNFQRAGIWIGEATPGRIDTAAIVWNGGPQFEVLAMTTPTALGGVVVAANVGDEVPTFLAIRRNSSTSYDFLFSRTGALWVRAVAARNPSITQATVGLFVNPQNGSVGVGAAFDWARVYTTMPGTVVT